MPRPQLQLPYLKRPYFLHGTEVRIAGSLGTAESVDEQHILERVFLGGWTAAALAEELDAAHGPPHNRVDEVLSKYAQAIGVAEVTLEPEYDIVVVEQGYGGVYVHTVELLKKLRERWNCLLICPEEPLFDDSSGTDTFTLRGLRRTTPGMSYFSFVHLVRSVVALTRCRLLLLAHRSQSLFLFDLLRGRRTVIYCDGFYDGGFARAQDFRLFDHSSLERRILGEIYYALANSDPNFFGLVASPQVNVDVLAAGCYSLRDAVENWCWGKAQTRNFVAHFPDLADRIRFMPPFTDPDLFHPEWVDRDQRILFTTTMHNIEKKGLPELLKAMLRIPDLEVRCVVRQPQHLPPIPEACRPRMEIGGLPKNEMVALYHRIWLNCRTSREESSPVSILETMICEVPQVVSPVVADQIPILEHGRTGFIVDPDDTRGLVRALRTLLEDPELRDRMGAECRQRACDYSFDARAHRFEELLR